MLKKHDKSTLKKNGMEIICHPSAFWLYVMEEHIVKTPIAANNLIHIWRSGEILMPKSDVFDRTGNDVMTRGAFYLVLGCVLTWGFVATYIVAESTSGWQPSLWEILGWGLAVPIVGILLSISSNAFVSFIGFNCVVIPLGAILGPVLAKYNLAYPGLVVDAASLTAAVTGIMAVTGLMFPSFYKSIGGALFGALSCLVIVSLLSLFIPALQHFTIIHYIAAGIFALYIGFDMYRASTIPATLDNAVDVAISLYLDIINLFLQILKILAESQGSDD